MQKMIFWDWTGTLADESRLDAAVCRTMEAELAQANGISKDRAASRFQAYLKTLENTWPWHDYLRHAHHFGLNWHKNILATNAVRAVVLLRLEHSGVETLFDAIVASDDAGALKAEGRHFACISNLPPEDYPCCFSVGDNPVQDIRPAKKLGLQTIYCKFGRELTHYHSHHLSDNHDILANADHGIRELRDIESIL